MVSARPGFTKMGCLFVLLLMAATVYFGLPVGETYFRYLEYKDRMKVELRFRGGLPNERIARNLKMAADSIGLPEEAGKVLITRKDGQVTVEADYEEIIHLPGYQKALRFQPKATDTY
jgi:hypothetical protein